MDDEWLEVPAARQVKRAQEMLTPVSPEEPDQPEHRTGDPTGVNLAAPEHREKLKALFRWAAEGRSWEEIRDDAVAMVFPSRKPPSPR